MTYLYDDQKQHAQSKKNRARYYDEFVQALLIDVFATEVITDEPNQSAQGICNHISYVRRSNCKDVLDGLGRNTCAEHNEQLAPEVQLLEVCPWPV
jgi:hypothetical protein